MLGSFATPLFRQAGFQHYLPLNPQHNTIRDDVWRRNAYQLYGILAPPPIMTMTGVDFQTSVGEITIPGLPEVLTMTGVDFASEVGSIDLATVVRSACRTGHDLTPFFLEKQKQTNPSSIVRQFSFNNSIFTNRVMSFPAVTQTYKDVTADGFTVTLENASQLMNEIIENRTKFRQEGELNYGYQFNTSHIDFGCVAKGTLINADYKNSQVDLTFKNQLDRLSEIKISTDTTSQQGASFVSATFNPADLTLDILTSNSYGAKLDNTASTANTDINYQSWLNWKNNLGSESIVVQAFFPYQTNYVSALQNIAEITDSAIYIESDNKINFIRNLTGVQSFSATITNSDILDISAAGDAFDMCNEYTVPISFTVASNSVTGFRQTIRFENTASVNSFGKISKEPTNNLVWYVDSGSALNLAQRIVGRRRQPEVALKVKTPIKFMQQQLGDIIFVTNDELNLNAEPFTLISKTTDIENQTITMDLSVGHGLTVGNFTVFELDDDEIGVLDSDAGQLA